jgi:hypothetical protein
MDRANHQKKHKTTEETTLNSNNNGDEQQRNNRDYGLKAGTRKQTRQFSLLALTIFHFSIASLLTKALLITVQQTAEKL